MCLAHPFLQHELRNINGAPPSKPSDESIDSLTRRFTQDGAWHLKSKVQEYYDRDKESGFPDSKLGITWTDLSVEAISADAALHENVISQYNLFTQIKESRQKPPLRTILSQSHGNVKPGEMLLVLGSSRIWLHNITERAG